MARLNFVPPDYGLRWKKRWDYGLARFRARRFQVVAIGDENMPQITGWADFPCEIADWPNFGILDYRLR